MSAFNLYKKVELCWDYNIQCMLFTVLNNFFAEDALCASVP